MFFHIVVKIIKKGVSITTVSEKVGSKTVYRKDYKRIESVIRVQLHLSGRRGKFEDFLEFSARYVYPFQ